MRPPFDDLDEFAFNDSAAVSRILREQWKEERRFAHRKAHESPGDEEEFDDVDYEDDDDYEDYGDYNEDEFDEYSDSDH